METIISPLCCFHYESFFTMNPSFASVELSLTCTTVAEEVIRSAGLYTNVILSADFPKFAASGPLCF